MTHTKTVSEQDFPDSTIGLIKHYGYGIASFNPIRKVIKKLSLDVFSL